MHNPVSALGGCVRALVVAERHGRKVIVSGNDDGSICVWDLERGKPVGNRLPRFSLGEVSALVVAERQGREVIVSGSDNGTIHVLDLERGKAVDHPLNGHVSRVSAIVVAKRQVSCGP